MIKIFSPLYSLLTSVFFTHLCILKWFHTVLVFLLHENSDDHSMKWKRYKINTASLSIRYKIISDSVFTWYRIHSIPYSKACSFPGAPRRGRWSRLPYIKLGLTTWFNYYWYLKNIKIVFSETYSLCFQIYSFCFLIICC